MVKDYQAYRRNIVMDGIGIEGDCVGNALVAKMEKLRNHFLVEKVVVY